MKITFSCGFRLYRKTCLINVPPAFPKWNDRHFYWGSHSEGLNCAISMRITEITQSSPLEYFVWVCRQILYIYFNVSWGMSLICSATVLVTQSTGISNHLYPMKWMEMPLIRSKFPHISARKTGKKNGPNNWSDLENVVSRVTPIWKHHGTRWRFYEQIRRAIAIIMKCTLWGFVDCTSFNFCFFWVYG